jgi:hypothetical protein
MASTFVHRETTFAMLWCECQRHPQKNSLFCVYKKGNGVMVIPEGETTYCRRGPPGTTKKTKND